MVIYILLVLIWEVCGRNQLQPSLICYCICWDELSKTTKCVGVTSMEDSQTLELPGTGKKANNYMTT
jgi:hypothetical protein